MTPDRYERTRAWVQALARDMSNRREELAAFAREAESKGKAMHGCPNERARGCALLRESEFAQGVLDAWTELDRERKNA